MMDASKYRIGYFPAPGLHQKWVTKDHIEEAPIWCSVDLRDGNQSLVIPMSLEEKLLYFQMLVSIGFKEIEVGFPAASDTEYEFVRTLIERNLIPEDVTIQVVTPCREHIIQRTFEACRGARSVIIHFYNSTSIAQREQVFQKTKDQILDIAVTGAKLLKQYAAVYDGNFRFEYSPESFTGTEPEYALEICNAVLDVLEPSADNPVIINIPATVEMSLPHIYAGQVEYIHENLRYRSHVILSLHPHNDRGTGVADTELGLLAGAQRVEGTLFGNGERTGNVDLVTLALNLYSHGIDPKLDFSDMPQLIEVFEKCTRMRVHDRSPYAGDLVFAAFSGSHQDAIAKGMRYRDENQDKHWSVPYIPIDPRDINRTYDADIIRVNSQSGKGGIGFLLEQNYGYILPPAMREDLSLLCKRISDQEHKELKVSDIYEIFQAAYFRSKDPISVGAIHFFHRKNIVETQIEFITNEGTHTLRAFGNGSLDAISNALKNFTGIQYRLEVYTEHSMQGHGSGSVAAAYIGIRDTDGNMSWGACIDTDIIHAGANALLGAFNNMKHKM